MTLHYVVSVGDVIYDKTPESEPLEITLGKGALPVGAEEALYGLNAGQEAFVTLPPEQAYGAVDPLAIETAPLASFKDLGPLTAGQRVLGLRGGKPAEATIAAVDDSQVRLDFNHRLAGKTVSFRLRLLSVSP